MQAKQVSSIWCEHLNMKCVQFWIQEFRKNKNCRDAENAENRLCVYVMCARLNSTICLEFPSFRLCSSAATAAIVRRESEVAS